MTTAPPDRSADDFLAAPGHADLPHNPASTIVSALDLDAIEAEWLRQCASCDAGLGAPCTCPDADHRPVIARLIKRARDLADNAAQLGIAPISRAAVAGAIEHERLRAAFEAIVGGKETAQVFADLAAENARLRQQRDEARAKLGESVLSVAATGHDSIEAVARQRDRERRRAEAAEVQRDRALSDLHAAMERLGTAQRHAESGKEIISELRTILGARGGEYHQDAARRVVAELAEAQQRADRAHANRRAMGERLDELYGGVEGVAGSWDVLARMARRRIAGGMIGDRDRERLDASVQIWLDGAALLRALLRAAPTPPDGDSTP